MKRIAIALIAAVMGTGALGSIAEARPGRGGEERREVRSRVVTKDKSRQPRAQHRSGRRSDRPSAAPWRGRSRDDRSHRYRDSRSHRRYRDNQYHRGYSRPRWHSYPIYRAFERSSRILLRSHYDSGYGYRSLNHWYGPSVLRFINVYPDGSCDVWFNGAQYHGYSRHHGGHQVLYLGTAPTRLGFGLELVLY